MSNPRLGRLVAAAALFMGSLLLEDVRGAGPKAKLTDCDTSEDECTEFFENDFPSQVAGCFARHKIGDVTNICTFNTANIPDQDATATNPKEPGSGCKKADKGSTCDKLCQQTKNKVYSFAYKVCLTKQHAYECTPKESKTKKFCGCAQLADSTKVKDGQKVGDKCG